MSALNRRQLLGVLGGVALGGAAGSLLAAPGEALAGIEPETTPFSWKPHILDPKEVAPLAHQGFYHQGYGCGYGVFVATVGLMGKKFGDPYKSFPFSMMEMGKSGVSEYGSLCGALLGAVAALALFWGRKDRDPMVHELFRWYETTAFPLYMPPDSLKEGLKGKLAASVSDSVLCHISVGRWSHASNLPALSKERSERCARITADVAVKVTELMAAKIGGTFKNVLAPSDTAKHCFTCHGDDPKQFSSPNLKGKMDCRPCHTGSQAVADKMKNHP